MNNHDQGWRQSNYRDDGAIIENIGALAVILLIVIDCITRIWG